MSNIFPEPTPARAPWALLASGVAAIGWAYWPTIETMADKWSSDPQYSHGYLVPLFSAYLIWRTKAFDQIGRPAPLLGAALLIVAICFRWLAGGLLFHQLDAVALLLSLGALAFVTGGVPLAKATAPAVLFLAFMVPLPYEIERNVGGPLKVAATHSSTYLLQTLGHPAIAEGHIILIDDVRLGVVDACSGLKMLMTFSAFAVGAILLLDRTRFEKLMILFGILPIAVVTNVLRITATGVAHTMSHDKDVLNFTHDLHGWLMMPAGLALLGLQLWCLSRLVVRPPDSPTFAPLQSVS